MADYAPQLLFPPAPIVEVNMSVTETLVWLTTRTPGGQPAR